MTRSEWKEAVLNAWTREYEAYYVENGHMQVSLSTEGKVEAREFARRHGIHSPQPIRNRRELVSI